ncbi:hypothetical protein ABTH85_19090 [Acinetobacter baumannii]
MALITSGQTLGFTQAGVLRPTPGVLKRAGEAEPAPRPCTG